MSRVSKRRAPSLRKVFRGWTAKEFRNYERSEDIYQVRLGRGIGRQAKTFRLQVSCPRLNSLAWLVSFLMASCSGGLASRYLRNPKRNDRFARIE